MFYYLNGLQMGMTRLKKKDVDKIKYVLDYGLLKWHEKRRGMEEVPQQSGFTINPIHDMERGMCDICII